MSCVLVVCQLGEKLSLVAFWLAFSRLLAWEISHRMFQAKWGSVMPAASLMGTFLRCESQAFL